MSVIASSALRHFAITSAFLICSFCSLCFGQGAPVIEVTNSGEHPRKLLKFDLEVGSKQVSSIRWITKSGESVGSTNVVTKLVSDFELRLKTTVTDRISSDSWSVEYEIVKTRVCGVPEGHSFAAMESNLSKMVGLTWRVVFYSDGRIRNGKVIKSVSVMSGSQEQALMKQLSESAFVLPTTEVGIGAKWNVVSRVQHELGFDFDFTGSVHLVKSESQGCHAFDVGFRGDPNAKQVVDGNLSFSVNSFSLMGSDTIQIALNKPMPISGNLVLNQDVSGVLTSPDGKYSFSASSHSSMSTSK